MGVDNVTYKTHCEAPTGNAKMDAPLKFGLNEHLIWTIYTCVLDFEPSSVMLRQRKYCRILNAMPKKAGISVGLCIV